jgi:hypothetical protein
MNLTVGVIFGEIDILLQVSITIFIRIFKLYWSISGCGSHAAS